MNCLYSDRTILKLQQYEGNCDLNVDASLNKLFSDCVKKRYTSIQSLFCITVVFIAMWFRGAGAVQILRMEEEKPEVTPIMPFLTRYIISVNALMSVFK